MINREDLRDTMVVVDLNKIKHNVKLIKDMVNSGSPVESQHSDDLRMTDETGCPDVAVMAVVKANGYGLGAVGISPAIMEAGADYLAVATLTEALELREAFSDYPLFILGYTPNRLLGYVVENNITQTIFSLEQACLLDRLAEELGTIAKVHIKVDTGFHRLGCAPSKDFAREICAMFSLKHVDVEGLFTHLALVNNEENDKQYRAFCDFISLLERRGCNFRYKHIADSIATVDYPRYRMNMVRPGALIYGMRGFHTGFLPVEQAVTFVTRISQIHRIKKGEGVGYDYLWKAERDSVIATLPFGFADGYPRNLRDKGYVIINGSKAPLVGVICMDQCMADVTDIPDAAQGVAAIIYGDGSDGSMTIEEASKAAGTNKNDIIARISARPPRKYIGGK